MQVDFFLGTEHIIVRLVPHPPQDLEDELCWVELCIFGAPIEERLVGMGSWTTILHALYHGWGVAHEGCRLRGWPLLTVGPFGFETILALVCSGGADIVSGEEFLDARLGPAAGTLWVLVKKITFIFPAVCDISAS